MYRLFSLILLIQFCLAYVSINDAHAEDCGENTYSNLPMCGNQSVFEGKDTNMPETSSFQIAIDVHTSQVGGITPPGSILEAFKFMREVLPHWYIRALWKSHGDEECNVEVNGESYSVITSSWLLSKWGTVEYNSALRKNFRQLGVIKYEDVEQALMIGFCVAVKQDATKGLDAIRSRGIDKEKGKYIRQK